MLSHLHTTVIGTGSHTITATYNADTSHATSSGTATVTVIRGTVLPRYHARLRSSSTRRRLHSTVTDTSPGTIILQQNCQLYTAGTAAGTLGAPSCTLASGSCSVTFTPSSTGTAQSLQLRGDTNTTSARYIRNNTVIQDHQHDSCLCSS